MTGNATDIGAIGAARAELTRLLRLATKIEQALLCQYLFAAFSLKRRHEEGGVTYAQLEAMRDWEAQLLLIARQEMEHLGIVLNLRNAIGDQPDFVLPEFPFSDSFDGGELRAELAPFSCKTITAFALAEKPEKLDPNGDDYRLLKTLVHGFEDGKYDTVARLYDRIGDWMNGIPEDALLVGSPGAQLDTYDVFPGEIRGLNLIGNPAYNVTLRKILTKKDALAAIDQIKSEGEGADEHGGPGSHFGRVMGILRALVDLTAADLSFAPARNVVENPGTPGAVDHPVSREVLSAFEFCNRAMLIGLSRYFAFPICDPAEKAVLQQNSFFPMMTTMIRPLGEALTLLPARLTGDGDLRAGASFGAGGPVAAPENGGATLRLIDEACARAQDILAALLEGRHALVIEQPDLKVRLRLVKEQIERSRMNIAAARNGDAR
jgi:hypothetical protein